MNCVFEHYAPAIGWFWFPDGCYCQEDQLQPLCAYHAERSRSLRYEIKEFIYWGA